MTRTMKSYINELTNKQNFNKIPELKMVQKDVLGIINLTVETINSLDPLLIVELFSIFWVDFMNLN